MSANTWRSVTDRWSDLEREIRERIAILCSRPIGEKLAARIELEIHGHQVVLQHREGDCYDVLVTLKRPLNMISVDIVLEGPDEWEVQWRMDFWLEGNWSKFPPTHKRAALQCARKIAKLRRDEGAFNQLTINVFQDGRLIYVENTLPENDETTD